MGEDRKLLVIGFVWPEPTATAAGSRMLQLLHCFIEAGYQLTFASTAVRGPYSLDMEAMGVTTKAITLNDASFDAFVKVLNPQIVLFDRFLTEEQFGWRITEQLPDAVRILDTEDLHSLRYVREQAVKKEKAFSIADWLESEKTKREIASIYRSDCSLMISTYEMELLEKYIGINDRLLVHIPFMVAKVDAEDWVLFKDRAGFICIGNGKHAPNVDAVLWLKKTIWPVIRQWLPQAQVRIYGAYLPEKVKQLHHPQTGFHIMGRAPEVHEVMGRARVNLAPLRFGAGIKGKLIDGMLSGTPSVTTRIGAEGMHDDLPWNGVVVDEVAAFAKAAVQLYQEEEKWHQAQQNGIKIIQHRYQKEKLQEGLLSKIEHIQTNLRSHRNMNFIGAMLQQQQMASTKYMSKWIEEKNKSL